MAKGGGEKGCLTDLIMAGKDGYLKFTANEKKRTATLEISLDELPQSPEGPALVVASGYELLMEKRFKALKPPVAGYPDYTIQVSYMTEYDQVARYYYTCPAMDIRVRDPDGKLLAEHHVDERKLASDSRHGAFASSSEPHSPIGPRPNPPNQLNQPMLIQLPPYLPTVFVIAGPNEGDQQ
jgi:hypothetical protein